MIVALALTVVTAPVFAQGAGDGPALDQPQWLAPTLPGAPFLAVSERTDLVLERLEVLTQLDALRRAEAALLVRSTINTSNSPDYDETRRILSSQLATLERAEERIVIDSEPLREETSEFGLGIAAFPVAELRKPFFNDWGRPRSGGRSHIGTDLLAQIGVELRAIEDSTVERTTNGGLGGLSIYLVGDSGSRYFYTHLDEVIDFDEGQRVYAGQAVGTIGDSGNARGAPHLHMQWAPNGGSDWENPFPLLDVLFGKGAAAEALAGEDISPEADSAVSTGADHTLRLLNADS